MLGRRNNLASKPITLLARRLFDTIQRQELKQILPRNCMEQSSSTPLDTYVMAGGGEVHSMRESKAVGAFNLPLNFIQCQGSAYVEPYSLMSGILCSDN